MCEVYIGEQTRVFYFDFFTSFFKVWPKDSFGNLVAGNISFNLKGGIRSGQKVEGKILIDKMMLYWHACVQFGLDAHKQNVKDLLVALCENANSATKSKNYPALPSEAKTEVLESLCKKFSQCDHETDADDDDASNSM